MQKVVAVARSKSLYILIFAGIFIVVLGVGWVFNRRKQRALNAFTSHLGMYLESLKNGKLGTSQLDALLGAIHEMQSLPSVKKKGMQGDEDAMSQLLLSLEDYTQRLSQANGVILLDKEFSKEQDQLTRLEDQLNLQRSILQPAA